MHNLGWIVLLVAASISGWLGHSAWHEASWWSALLALSFWVLALALVLRETWQLHSLRRWLRSQGRIALPTLRGRWQELGERMQRWDKRRKRQRDLHAQRLQALLVALQDAPFGLVLLGKRDVIEWCNQTAAQHLQLHPQRDYQQRIAFIVRSPGFVQLLQNAAGSLHWQTADGLELEVLLHAWQADQRLLLTRDISEEQRLLKVQKNFVSHVSHEIRTPLTVLLGFAESLQTLPLSEQERSLALQHMHTQGQQMLALVEDLLQLAGLESQRLAPQMTTIDVAELLQQCVESALLWQKAWLQQQGQQETTAPTLTLKGVSNHNAGAAAPTLLANANELQSAIGNLLRNALRYAPAGSTVQLCWSQEEDQATIAVRDQGPGIAPWHIARLGEPFYRIENGHHAFHGTGAAAGHAGTGLGLTIVRQIARRHEGALIIESQLHKGSTFSLRLPRKKTLPLNLDAS